MYAINCLFRYCIIYYTYLQVNVVQGVDARLGTGPIQAYKRNIIITYLSTTYIQLHVYMSVTVRERVC